METQATDLTKPELEPFHFAWPTRVTLRIVISTNLDLLSTIEPAILESEEQNSVRSTFNLPSFTGTLDPLLITVKDSPY